jgi:beta-xylosidase
MRRASHERQASKARDEAGGLPLYYTEWNISSNPRDPLHDEPFAAAFITRIIMEARGLVQGYSFWTFSDIFSENYFPICPVSRWVRPPESARDRQAGLSRIPVVAPFGHSNCWK